MNITLWAQHLFWIWKHMYGKLSYMKDSFVYRFCISEVYFSFVIIYLCSHTFLFCMFSVIGLLTYALLQQILYSGHRKIFSVVIFIYNLKMSPQRSYNCLDTFWHKHIDISMDRQVGSVGLSSLIGCCRRNHKIAAILAHFPNRHHSSAEKNSMMTHTLQCSISHQYSGTRVCKVRWDCKTYLV